MDPSGSKEQWALSRVSLVGTFSRWFIRCPAAQTVCHTSTVLGTETSAPPEGVADYVGGVLASPPVHGTVLPFLCVVFKSLSISASPHCRIAVHPAEAYAVLHKDWRSAFAEHVSVFVLKTKLHRYQREVKD